MSLLLVMMSRGLEGARKGKEEKKGNLERNLKAVQIEMSLQCSTLLLPFTDTLNTCKVEMYFGFALEKKSHQITNSACHF